MRVGVLIFVDGDVISDESTYSQIKSFCNFFGGLKIDFDQSLERNSIW